MAISAEELVFVLRAKIGDFVQGLKKAGGEAKKMDSIWTRMGRSLRVFGVASVAIGAAGAAMAAFGKRLAAAASQLATAAAQNEITSRSFEKLAVAAGSTATAELSKLRASIGGTLTDLKLMQNIGAAVDAGLTFEQSRIAIEFLRRYSLAFGKDFNQLVSTIFTGLQRGSTLMLDDAGIIIDASSDIYKGLSEVEKKSKLVADAIDLMGQKMEYLPPIQKNAITLTDRLSVSYQNLKIEIGERLLPVFNALAQKIGDVAKKLTDMLSDENVQRLKDLGKVDLAARLEQNITKEEQRARLSALRVDAQRARLDLGDPRFTAGRLEGITGDAVSKTLLEAQDAEAKAIGKVIDAQTRLNKLKRQAGVFAAAGTQDAEATLDAAREELKGLKTRTDQLQKFLDIMRQIQNITATIDAHPRRPVVPLDIFSEDTPEDVLVPFFEERLSRYERPKIPIEFEFPEDLPEDVDIADAFLPLDDLPASFEENMRKAFDHVQDMAYAFGIRTHGILSSAFQLTSGASNLLGFAGAVGTGSRIASTLGKVAGVLGPVAAVVGGAVGVFQGIKSLFSSPPPPPPRPIYTTRTRPLGELSDQEIQSRIDAIKPREPLVEDPETGELIAYDELVRRYPNGRYYRPQTIYTPDQTERIERYRTELRTRQAEREATGQVTYSTTVTLTEDTGRLMLNEISTMATYMQSLESLTLAANADRKLILSALDNIQSPTPTTQQGLEKRVSARLRARGTK